MIMKAVWVCTLLLVLLSAWVLAASPFEIVKKESKIEQNIFKISLLTLAAFIILALSIYLKIKLKEKSENNVQKIKAVIRASLQQGKKPLAITRQLTQVYPPQEIKEAMQQALQDLIEKE